MMSVVKTRARTLGRTATLSALLVASGLGFGAVTLTDAHAHGGKGDRAGSRIERMFTELDANSDGVVTKAEIEAHRQARFTAADTDGDGALSVDEVIAAAQKRMAERTGERMRERFAKMDADKDGRLTLEETAGRMSKWLGRVDENADGAIDRAEMMAFKSKMGQHHGKGGAGHQ